MSLDILKSWFNETAHTAGLDAEFDEDGVCTLEISEEIPVAIAVSDSNPDLFVMVALVAPLSGDPLTDLVLMKRALILNRFQLETAGGTLAIGPHTGAINFVFTHAFEKTDDTVFGNIFGNFITTSQRLRQELLKEEGGETLKPSGPGDGEIPDYSLRV